MIIFPAIDLSGGCAVRLTQGDFSKKKVYDVDPISAVERFRKDGASCLHVVDLDGARNGTPENMPVIRQIVEKSGLFIQTGGGIRTMQRIEEYLSIGVGRVILGTAAVRNPELLQEAVIRYSDKISVGVDAKNGRIALSGWLEQTDIDSVEFCQKMLDTGVKTIIYTDISKDGALVGTNLKIYDRLQKLNGLQIIASGGISSLKEIQSLARTGIYGAIIGKALYEGLLSLPEVLKAAAWEEK